MISVLKSDSLIPKESLLIRSISLVYNIIFTFPLLTNLNRDMTIHASYPCGQKVSLQKIPHEPKGKGAGSNERRY